MEVIIQRDSVEREKRVKPRTNLGNITQRSESNMKFKKKKSKQNYRLNKGKLMRM